MNNTTEKKIRAIVARVRRKHNITTEHFTEADFYRICEAENIRIVSPDIYSDRLAELAAPLAADGLKGFLLNIGGRRLLFLASLFDGEFDAFTAYHEIGHFYLHKGRALAMIKLDDYDPQDETEREADMFAELATGIKREAAV
jgi:Zn-dependent peptidase ImmA (M78 family)